MKTVNEKILPEYFSEVLKGTKTFELRKDEDEIQVGDIIVLNEWNGDFTGRKISKKVTYVPRHKPLYGLQEGYCIACWN